MERTNPQNVWAKIALSSLCFSIIAIGLIGCGKGKQDKTEKKAEASAPAVVQDWPIFRRDAELQGESTEDLAFPLEPAWTFEPKLAEEGKRRPPIDASPVIADGVVYVGSQEGRFFALNLEDGSKIWEFKAEGPIAGPAAVYGSRVFFGDTYGFFYSLNVEGGIEAWRFETDAQVQGGANLLETEDGIVRVFFGSDDYHIYCLDAGTGKELWKHETDNYVAATPCLINSGGKQAVAFGGCDGFFMSFRQLAKASLVRWKSAHILPIPHPFAMGWLMLVTMVAKSSR